MRDVTAEGTSVEALRRRRHCENLGASIPNDRDPHILTGRRLCDEALKVSCTAHIFTVEDGHDVTGSHVSLCRRTHRAHFGNDGPEGRCGSRHDSRSMTPICEPGPVNNIGLPCQRLGNCEAVNGVDSMSRSATADPNCQPTAFCCRMNPLRSPQDTTPLLGCHAC